MRDIQNERDERAVPLQKVGVRGVRYPVKVLDRANKTQVTTATVDLFVNLPHDFKGTHMSRFIEIFHQYHEDVSMRRFLAMLDEMRARLEAERAFGTMTFPFFVEKSAPVSAQSGMMCYECTYEGEVAALPNAAGVAGSVLGAGAAQSAKPGAVPLQGAARSAEHSTGQAAPPKPNTTPYRRFTVSVAVPVTTLCPCSKAISGRGAHNQRGIVRVKLQSTAFFWIEDIIELVEKSASCAVYSLLKREDEKFVTEHAYDNPRFVEDVVREVYLALTDFGGAGAAFAGGASGITAGAGQGAGAFGNASPFVWFSVEAENFESIHNHNAYAYTEWSRP